MFVRTGTQLVPLTPNITKTDGLPHLVAIRLIYKLTLLLIAPSLRCPRILSLHIQQK